MYEFSQDELLIIAAALHAVTPSGGGSHEYSLAGKVTNLLDDVSSETLENRAYSYIQNVIAEAAEYAA